MLTRGEDVEVHALKERGWSISAIARHLWRDRKTVRSRSRSLATAQRSCRPGEDGAPSAAHRPGGGAGEAGALGL